MVYCVFCTAFFYTLKKKERERRYAWRVYMYYNLYYVAILCIVVLSKHYNDNG